MRTIADVIAAAGSRKTNLSERRRCWRDSTTTETKWTPLARAEAGRRWHKLRRLDCSHHVKGKHGGVVGRVALHVYHTLAFDCLRYATGKLDPALQTIAARAGCSRRAAVDALHRLRAIGAVTWERRCEVRQGSGGQYELHQLTNAYRLPAPALWRSGDPSPPPPPPEPGTSGEHPPLPDELDLAAEKAAVGDSARAVAELELAPTGSLERALAALGRAIFRSAATAKHPKPG
jgi:hypothetical protein